VTVTQLHPEALLDREARRALSPAERVGLDAHVAACAACRCERKMRADFARALSDGSARPGPTGHGAAEGRGQDRQDPQRRLSRGDARGTSTPTRTRTWRGRALALLVVLVAAGALVAAALPTAAPVAAPRRPLVLTAARAASPGRAAAFARAAAPGPVAPSGHAAASERGAEVGQPPAPALPEAAASPSAEGLFAQANHARVRADYREALARYRELQRRWPESRQAQVSYATMGRLQLDLGDPAGALASYDRYDRCDRASAGALDEAVMAGRARAFEQLGRDREAARAWVLLTEAHPDTAYAPRGGGR
jgi:tetratricopeptide (TPR) repeat protein